MTQWWLQATTWVKNLVDLLIKSINCMVVDDYIQAMASNKSHHPSTSTWPPLRASGGFHPAASPWNSCGLTPGHQWSCWAAGRFGGLASLGRLGWQPEPSWVVLMRWWLDWLVLLVFLVLFLVLFFWFLSVLIITIGSCIRLIRNVLFSTDSFSNFHQLIPFLFQVLFRFSSGNGWKWTILNCMDQHLWSMSELYELRVQL